MLFGYHVGLDIDMDASTAWRNALQNSPISGKEFLAQVGQAGVLFDGKPLCVHRQPLFLSEQQVQEMARILAVFHGAVRKAKRMLLQDGFEEGALAECIGLSASQRELAAIEPGYASASVLSRVDCFCPKGHPWILELNAESPTGMGYTDALTDLMRDDPLFAHAGPFGAFRSTDAALRALLSTYSEWGGQGFPQMAIVDFLDVPTRGDFHLIAQSFERHGIVCSILDPRDLSFESGILSGPGGPIDLVYRRVLVQDILQRPAECKALLDAYRAGAVCLVNSLRTPLLHSKGLFALLHSSRMQEVLSSAEKKVIAEHLPFTVMASSSTEKLGAPEAFDDALMNRAEWVIKPVSQSGGQGVLFGEEASQEAWESRLSQPDPAVLQRVVPGWVQPFPDAREAYAEKNCMVDLDPFLIRGRLAGFMCRLSQRAPVNVAQGAHLVPVFVSSGVDQ